MCGGDLEVDQSMAIGTCQHCGSTMTLPKASDERIANLFNRANHYRRSSEFDKALKVYESILNEDNGSAEAYWGLVLCRYGIEYVEDPQSGQRSPTCHRAQKTSISMDADYKQAIEYADETARALYKAEAATIDAIQKQILAISEQEAPYDIFICYKETSETGSRTKDSVMAQDIYHHLTEESYKVFFSRISLEDKLGTAYEPYIFAALNSSKVMIVVATSTENVNAVWTKNEWSRYLALINKGEKKTLIPVYRDMDPYDLPEEFAHLQAQDMGRLGFMQDLVRGVTKIFEGGGSKLNQTEKAHGVQASVTTQSLLERAFICLEDSEWIKADELLERALDIEPRNAKAYIGKLMVELHVSIEDKLVNQKVIFAGNSNYQKALRFADNNYKDILENYKQTILERVGEGIYQQALMKANAYGSADKLTEAECSSIAGIFRSISGYKDADSLALVYSDLAEKERIRKEGLRIFSKTISAGEKHIVGLRADGAVTAVGNNAYGQLNVIDWRERTAVAAGTNCTFSLRADGTVTAVGNNQVGQLNVDDWRDILAVAAGTSHTVGLTADGTVVAVGSNSNKQLDVGNWHGIVAVAAGTSHTVGLKADGTVVAVGSNANGQLNVEGWRDIITIASGGSHTVGLKADGTVVAVGSNANGLLNVGDWVLKLPTPYITGGDPN
jgi:tetratricopeptide (TPR) repeat protein